MTEIVDSLGHILFCRYCGAALTDKNCPETGKTTLKLLCAPCREVRTALWNEKIKQLWPKSEYVKIGVGTDGKDLYVRKVEK